MRQYIKTVLIGIILFTGGLSLGIFGGILLVRPEVEALWQENQELYQDIDHLQQNYTNLLDDYNSLFSNYNALQEAFEDPLTNPEIPTYSEVYYWLSTDDTDSFEYTENWMCGDFATMLMTRAKTMNWRMRISCMFYSFEGETGWQNPFDPYGTNGHAFNVILCQDCDGDGIDDWIYIEPQTDVRWHVRIGSVSYVHYQIWLTFTGGISGTVWTEHYYINHYSYFA